MPLIAALTIIIGIQFALLHAIAEYLNLYWYYPWLDLPMHFFGGLLLVLMLETLISIRVLPGGIATGRAFVGVMAVMLVLWELFGIARYGGLKPGYFMDTGFDLLFGILGIVCGQLVAKAIKRLT